MLYDTANVDIEATKKQVGRRRLTCLLRAQRALLTGLPLDLPRHQYRLPLDWQHRHQ